MDRIRCWKAAVLVAFVLLLVAPPLAAEAATITTGAIQAPGATESLRCRVANTGTSDANAVTIELIGTVGNVTDSLGPLILPAGSTISEATGVGPGIRWCRVTGISKGAGRVTLCVIDSSGNCIAAVTAP